MLRETIDADPEDAQRYLLLTQFLASQRDNDAAIKELESIAASKPDLTDLQFGLVQLYLGNDRKEDAKARLDQLITGQGNEPAGLRARVLQAQILAAEKDKSGRVDTLIAEVLEENPRDNDALLLRGRLAAGKQDWVAAINDFRSVLKDQPNSANVLKLLAAAHAGNKEIELAKDTMARAVDNSPGDFGVRLQFAKILAAEQNIDGALEQVDSILEREPENQLALDTKFDLLARKGDVEAMSDIAKTLQTSVPDSEDGFIREARLLFAQKKYDQALEVANGILTKNPESVPGLLTKSDILAGQQNYDGALDAVKKLQKVKPDKALGYYREAKLLLAKQDADGAILAYESALEKAPNSVETLTELVNVEIRVGKTANAKTRLNKLLADNPEHAAANDLLGIVFFSEKEFAKAEQYFLAQLKVSPKSSVVYARLANARSAQDDLDGATKTFEEGLEQVPDNTRLMIGLAGIKERQKDYDAAISLYEKILVLQPGNAVSVNNVAALLSDHRSDAASLEKAAEYAEKLVKAKQPAFQDTAGWVYYRRGEYDKALGILKGVVEKMPDVPVFQYHLGMTYYKTGDKAAAKEQLSQAVGENANYTGVEEARALLKDL